MLWESGGRGKLRLARQYAGASVVGASQSTKNSLCGASVFILQKGVWVVTCLHCRRSRISFVASPQSSDPCTVRNRSPSSQSGSSLRRAPATTPQRLQVDRLVHLQ